jgi:hypothetical protein
LTLDQQALRKRFADEIVGPHFQAEQFIDLLILRGEKDHRQVRFLPQPTQRLHAVHARHLDVKNGEIREDRLEPVEGRRAVRICVDAISFGLECNGYRVRILRSSSTRAMVGMAAAF